MSCKCTYLCPQTEPLICEMPDFCRAGQYNPGGCITPCPKGNYCNPSAVLRRGGIEMELLVKSILGFRLEFRVDQPSGIIMETTLT
jgi:hypothetical protein